MENFENDTSLTVADMASQIELKIMKLRRQPNFNDPKTEEPLRVQAESKLNERDLHEVEKKIQQIEQT